MQTRPRAFIAGASRLRLLIAVAAAAASAAACGILHARPDTARARPSRGEAVLKARDVLGDGRFQTEFPEEPRTETKPAKWDLRPDSPHASGPARGAGYLLTIVAWTSIAAVICLLVWGAVSALARSGLISRILPGRKAAPAAAAVEVGPLPCAAAVAGAESRASAGLYLDAVRMLFMDSARMVEEAAAIRLDRASTNGEYLGALPRESKYLLVMTAIALVVDACYYGRKECTREDWLACRSAFEGLSASAVEARS